MPNPTPLFQTSYFGSKVQVYSDRIVYKMLFSTKVIPLDQIASIDPGISGYAGIKIETTGGKKITIPVGQRSKQKLEDAIFQAKKGGTISPSSSISDLEKLAAMKDKGLVTQDEFNQTKKQLLGL